MTDRLEEIFDLQRKLQTESFGYDPVTMEGEERTQFIMWNVLALTDELHEALAEVGWKPWATSRHVNETRLQGELVDALHFLVNLCLAAGMSAEDLHEGYLDKRHRNAKRQEEGYDGVSGKCPHCKRALDDVGPSLYQIVRGGKVIIFCGARCAVEWNAVQANA